MTILQVVFVVGPVIGVGVVTLIIRIVKDYKSRRERRPD